MPGNSFGELFKVSTFGESHGSGVGCVIDAPPPGIELAAEDIQKDLDRRKPGQSEVTTQRREADTVEILSGLFEGRTTGSPLAMLIRNNDQRSADYSNIKDVFRPGHADYAFHAKYGVRDYRGGGRSSGRETAARVAAGAVARKILALKGIQIRAYTLAIAGVQARSIDLSVIEKNPVRCPDAEAAEQMVRAVLRARDAGDSVGGIVEVAVNGCPPGLGDPVFSKLEARLAQGIMSIGAVKGIEFGSGFASAGMFGSQHNDEISIVDGRVISAHNFAGGISGGISNGEPVVFRLAVKPASSISSPQAAATLDLTMTTIEIKGRHDPCLCPRVVPVAEAMTALVLADALLIQQSIKNA